MGNIWIAGSHDFYLVEEVCHFPPLGPGPVPQERFIYIYLSYQSRWSKKVSAEDQAAIIREPHSSNTDSCSRNDIRIKHRNKQFIQPPLQRIIHILPSYYAMLIKLSYSEKFLVSSARLAGQLSSFRNQPRRGTCIICFYTLFSWPWGFQSQPTIYFIGVCSRIATALGYSCVKWQVASGGKLPRDNS